MTEIKSIVRSRFPFQFGIVREDSRWERAFFLSGSVDAEGPILCVASAGDTALDLAHHGASVHLFDLNPSQIALAERKRVALANPSASERWRLFGGVPNEGGEIEKPNASRAGPAALDTGGAFEALFATLSGLIDRYVLDVSTLRTAMNTAATTQVPLRRVVNLNEVFAAPYWPVVFELAFSDALLHAMFTPAATQHARDPYPEYFRSVFERGLLRDDAATNPWLHHALFGGFGATAPPPLLHDHPRHIAPFEADCCSVQDVPSFAPYSAISVSNLFDWMSEEEGRTVVEKMASELQPGAKVLVRQLNSRAPLNAWFEFAFDLDHTLAAAFKQEDRSLFYDEVVFATRMLRE